MDDFNIKSQELVSKETERMEKNIKSYLKQNLNYLLNYYNVKKKVFQDITGISPSQYSKMFGKGCEDYNTPISIQQISAIACFFDISLYELCCTIINLEPEDSDTIQPFDTRPNRPTEEYNLFLGTYEGLYFDTSRPLGEEDRATPDSLSHVVMTIYRDANKGKDFSKATGNCYKVAALFNCPAEIVQEMVSGDLGNTTQGFYVENYYRKLTADYPHIYWGELTLTDQFAYIDVKQARSRDIAHIILHNKAVISSPKKKAYIGGLGVMASSARGAERMPCVQQILISRYPFSVVPDEEIAEMLYISLPRFSLNNSAQDLVTWIKSLFISNEVPTPLQQLNEEQKIAAVEVQLSRIIMEQMRKNAFRYRKISYQQDSDFYKKLKNTRKAAKLLSAETKEGE